MIVALLAVSAFLNYVDRQALSLLAAPIQRDLNIDDVGYGHLVSAFLIAYTLFNLVAAWIVDRLGARVGLALFVGWWSFAGAMSGFAQNVHQMLVTRFALGMGEVGNWVATPKLVREWFTPKDWALGIGLCTAAAMIGATLSPYLITGLADNVGWRGTFWLTGAVGFAWVAMWFLIYGPKRIPPFLTAPATPQGHKPSFKEEWPDWRGLIASPALWLLTVAEILTGPVWFFYLFWFPKYLTDERGMSVAAMGEQTWVVYAAAGIGALTGGILSGQLIRRGASPPRARLIIMTIAAVAAPIGALNAWEPGVNTSIALGALVAICHMVWLTNLTALKVDLFPAQHLGKAFGMIALIGGIASVASTQAIGHLVQTITYRPMFIVVAIAYPAALVAAFFATRASSLDPTITAVAPAGPSQAATT
ncbi:MFS transporter [Peristeroidobacter soli]|uniref:MFS transporter n=1 Tax=Peristeroidobacter soli TaxID=2497877 RepID=UPI0013007A73|nr:MFS transporter [Peristeroidobacter soli]